MDHFTDATGSDNESSNQSIESPASSNEDQSQQQQPKGDLNISFSDIVAHFRQRLISGHGEVILSLGMDDGELNEKDLLLCLDRLDSLASVIPCKASILHIEGVTTPALTPLATSDAEPSVTRKKTSLKPCSASVLFRLCPESMQDLLLEIRVAVVGNVDAGKSTTLGVLTKGTQDDGRGKAREDLFRHKHEASTGRTSSVGMEIMGFDAYGNVAGPPRAHPFLNEAVVTLGQALGKTETPGPANEKDLQTYKKMAWDTIMLQSTKVKLQSILPNNNNNNMNRF